MNEDELEIEEVDTSEEIAETADPLEEVSTLPESETPEGFLSKMYHALGGILKGRRTVTKDQIAQAAKILGITQKEMRGMMYPDEEEDEMEMARSQGRTSSPSAGRKKTSPKATAKAVPEVTQEETPMDKDELVKSATADLKAEMESVVKALRADLEKQYQDKITTLETKIETLSKSEAEQRDLREEREFLEKAMQYRAFPVQYTELAKMLRKLHGSLTKEEFEQWDAVLKAADQQLFAAGMFSEMGTSLTGEEVKVLERVEKQAKEKGISFKEALLNLPAHEQAALLDGKE